MKRAADLTAAIALVVGSLLCSLAVLELGCRLLLLGPKALIHWPNLVSAQMSNSEDGPGSCGYAYDAMLGWTLPANCASPGYNIDADGFRKASTQSFLAEPAVLATGSSFAMGYEAADEETWPAQLQKSIARRVVNAAVGGYSLDQTVLRTERLVPEVKPLLVIASFTPDDVRRNELRVSWSREKPYFTVASDRLELRNVPVPGKPGAPVSTPVAARLLGWSALAHVVADRLSIFNGWYYDEVQGAPSGSGAAISCLLMRRLAALDVPTVVIAEYPRSHWRADAEGKARDFAKTGAVLACAARAGLVAIDMAGQLEPAVAARGINVLFRSEHHSAEGNRATAEVLMQELVRRRLLPPTADR